MPLASVPKRIAGSTLRSLVSCAQRGAAAAVGTAGDALSGRPAAEQPPSASAAAARRCNAGLLIPFLSFARAVADRALSRWRSFIFLMVWQRHRTVALGAPAKSRFGRRPARQAKAPPRKGVRDGADNSSPPPIQASPFLHIIDLDQAPCRLGIQAL